MNYKLLFPTYRTRFRFVRDRLADLAPHGGFSHGLNLGSGEGDYDPMIAGACQRLISCDINPQDVEFARGANGHIGGLSYQVQGATNLNFPDGHFDAVVSVDVLEHVEDPRRMMREVARVLAPGGHGILTFPQTRFPFTYDPINRFAGRRALPLGAYAFGHETLIAAETFEGWLGEVGLEVLAKHTLSGALVGLTEMYWPGILQGFLKANSGNKQEPGQPARGLRPTAHEPGLVWCTDALINLDRRLFQRASRSIGLGYVLRKIGS